MTKTNKRHDRDGGRFLALPHVVLESEAFKSLTGQQIKLLIDIAMQLSAGNANNGRLQASWRYLSEDRGWTSKATIKRALDVLQERGLIFCSRQGRLPNRTSWFAVTWAPLHHHPEMDCGAQALPRGGYSRWKEKITPPCPKTVLTGDAISPKTVQEAAFLGPKSVLIPHKTATS